MKLNRSVVWAFAVALFVGAAAPSVSQAAPKDEPRRPAAGLAMLERAAEAESVALTEDQKSKVHTIIEDARAQMKALRDEAKAAGGADKAEKKEGRGAAAELMVQTKNRIEEILNDEQKTAFRASLQEARQKAKAERGPKGEGKGKGAKKAKA